MPTPVASTSAPSRLVGLLAAVSTLGCAPELPVSAAHNQDASVPQCPLPECVEGFKIGTPPGFDCPVCISKQKLRCEAGHPHSCAAHAGCGLGEESYVYRPGCCACRPLGCHDHHCDENEDCGPGRGPLLSPRVCCATCVAVEGEACPQCEDMTCPIGYAATLLTTGCCECRPTFKHCNDSSLILELVEFAADLTNARACTVDKDCTRQNIETACGVACGSAFHTLAATDVAQRVQEAAAPTCNVCSFWEFCNHPGLGATCSDGQCVP